jgi:hypothetical protein
LCELSAECFGLDEVRERPQAVDLDHRQQLSVVLLKLGIAGDVHLLKLEGVLGADGLEHAPRRLAEVAPGGVVEDDSGYGYGYRPRVIVASETRWTASPYAAIRIVVDFAS